jgi:DNA repair protein RadD
MTPRPYQLAALEALDQHICSKDTNPCVVLPTGAGKSPFMAWVIQHYMRQYPKLRAIVLAHVRELVQQNADKMLAIWPGAPVGIYSAGLKSRDMRQNIIFAGIQSVYSKACQFDPFDLIFIDEAHRVPVRGEGTYRQFIREARLCNPRVVVVGVTATPWRLGAGPICHEDHVLNEVVYNANVKDLIEQGYLCRLRSKVGDTQPDVSGVRKSHGDFVADALAEAVDRPDLVSAAVKEVVPLIADRKAVLFFCVNVSHAHHVSEELAEHGIRAPVLTGETPSDERARLTAGFVSGEIRALCNVRVLCEGFDATRTDAIVLMRPTASAGLFAQMCGRGLRLDTRKSDCLVLCFSGNLERHGPLDLMEEGDVELIVCGECGEMFSKAVGKCPDCGWPVPPEPPPVKVCEHCEAENPIGAVACVECGRPFDIDRGPKHRAKPSAAPIISDSTPWEVQVESVEIAKHEKAGAPPSLRVTYFGRRPDDPSAGNLSEYTERHREWVCLEHDGFARTRAHEWWHRRFGQPIPATVDEALASDLFLGQTLARITQRIRVKQAGKYTEVIGATLAVDQPAVIRR